MVSRTAPEDQRYGEGQFNSVLSSPVRAGTQLLLDEVLRLAPERSSHPWAWTLLSAGRHRSETIIERSSQPFEEFNLDAESVESEADFQRFRHFTAREGLYRTRHPTVVAPYRGWMVTRPLSLDTRGSAFHLYRDTPGVRRFLALRVAFRDPIRLKKAFSLRMHAEANYYHVLNDLVGGKLRLAEEGGVPWDVPIVISAALAAAPFFQEIQALPSMQGRRWVVQSARQFLRSDDVVFVETSRQGIKANFDHARLLLGVQDGDPACRDRLFVTRARSLHRGISNHEAIEQVCRRFGFRVVDTATMSLAQQMELFSKAGYVAGIHGAGLANIIFRKNAPLRVLEIFDPAYSNYFGYLPGTYFLISRMYDFDYRAMVGQSSEKSTRDSRSFLVDPARLAIELENMLA
jgi:hypothetical protein